MTGYAATAARRPVQSTAKRTDSYAELRKRVSFRRVVLMQTREHSTEDFGAEREFSDECGKRSGRPANGGYLPIDLSTRDLSVANDGALVGEDHLSDEFIGILRPRPAAIQAGVTLLQRLQGDVVAPRQTTGSTATWITAEDGDAAESEPQFDQVALTPKDLGVYCDVTRRLVQQSEPGVEAVVQRDFERAIAQAVDSAILYGTGANGQPTGIANTTGIGSVSFTAAAPTYPETLTMVETLLSENISVTDTTFLLDPTGWKDGRSTEVSSGSGRFIVDGEDRVSGIQALVSSQVTAQQWVLGAFRDALLGVWGDGVDLLIDPATHSLKGGLRIVAFLTCDIAVRRPESFVIGTN